MQTQKRLSIIVVSLLLFSGLFLVGYVPIRASTAASTIVPAQQQIDIRSGYYEYVEVDSFSSNTWVVYNVTSDNPISTAIMNSTQFNDFSNTTTDEISNSITYQNGTSVQEDLQIAPGQYFLVFYAFGSRAIVNFGFEVYPNTPLSYGALSSPQPSGIASFGISNDSGTVVPYEIHSSQIVGIANISSFLANNPNAATFGDNVAGATLQLNTNLVVNQTNGLQDVYWVQNTPDFVTSVNAISLTDNIWNNTDLTGFMTNQSLTSPNFANGGAVYASVSNGLTSYAYLFNENNMTYKMPFSFALVENESVLKGQGVLVQLGFRSLQNESLTTSSTYWYDNVTIHAPNVQSAYFEVAGNATTPIGSFYDSELVFAGEGNNEATSLLNMSASLGLFFRNDTTSVLSAFPSYYSFGGDTAESVTNLAVSYSNGIAYVQAGNPNYVYLGKASLTLGSDYKLPSTIFSTPVTTGSTSATAQSSSSGSLSGSSVPGYLWLVGFVIIIVVIVGVVALFVSRRRRPPDQSVQTFPQTIPMQASPSVCPSCGTLLPAGAAFCSNCGQRQLR
ncbi:MAG TPA: thermopsin family protease [Nitrososphaerales archaeon]|nr:thermopsin family protease [Nitrososphaerales archaeon]